MNVLITGGAGFIGSNLADFHLAKGDSVVAVDDLSTGRESNLAGLGGGRFRFHKADLLGWKGLENEVAVADRIYHMAAVVGMFHVLADPVSVCRVNIVATERLLEAVANSGRKPQVVMASSSSVYGQTTRPVMREEDELVFASDNGGLTAYGLSKLANEIQGVSYHAKFGIPVTLPRLFNAAGPRQTGTYGFVLPRFIDQAKSGRPLTVFGDGSQTRSFCDVRDTIRALDLLASAPAASGVPVNVGSTREISILDLARLVIERAGSRSDIEFIPFDQAYGCRFAHIMQRHPMVDRLEQLTGFRPRWTLEDTIDDLLRRDPDPPPPG